MDFQELLREFNLTPEFSLAVVDEIESIPEQVPEDEMKGRRDLTNLNIFTIDGEDAKDLDDAVSITTLDNGNYLLGVHIADVSHYVRENTNLDREAMERGTSVYLVDTVVPMLPKKLSNGVCSLNPHTIRLTLSVFMELTDRANIVDYEICESYICSKHRLTYTAVTSLLEGDSELEEKYKDIADDLRLMQRLASQLTQKRFRRGGLDFDLPETKVITDEDGVPVEIKKYEVTISNHIIEEFMLACNETVARHMNKLEIPSVYRVHEKPESGKVEKLILMLRGLGYNYFPKETISSNSLQKVLGDFKDSPYSTAVSTVLLRSMMKARYCEKNLGHFGLAAVYYCHFTSPIRRYPDLAVHRILKTWLHGELDQWKTTHFEKYAKKAADLSSDTEVNAVDAERKWTEAKICEYMKNFIGQDFEAIIMSVTSFGLFAELDNSASGLIPMSELKDDYYIYDEINYCLVGRRTKNIYRIGDTLKVRLVRVDEELLQIDFVPIENVKKENQKKRVIKNGQKAKKKVSSYKGKRGRKRK
ncbi:MAG: ribonuclease R [Eubacteriales bacterium]|nr:ribonuclease R [Eubacteriales bacterium]